MEHTQRVDWLPDRVAIVGSNPTATELVIGLVRSLGIDAFGETSSAAAAVELVRTSQPQLLLICADLAGADPRSISAIQDELDTPVVIIAENDYPTNLRCAGDLGVFGFLIMPASPPAIRAALDVAWSRHRHEQTLRQQVSELETALADRKIIERAKGLLMQRLNLSEEDAIRRLRREARDTRIKLVDRARAVIEQEMGGGETEEKTDQP